MKKRLLIYLSVIIGCLFIGLTTLYLIRNYEFISVTASSGNEIYLNIKESETLSITHDNKAEETSLSATISDESVISFDLKTGVVTALNGGTATLTINSSNEDFGPFTFEVRVGDGKTVDTPFYIKNADDLIAIGNTRTYEKEISHDWSMDSFYQMVNSIDLSGKEWTPIGSYSDNNPFTGSFSGNNNTISNMSITKNNESAGMFAYLSEFSSVDSVKFENSNIQGAFEYAGVVAGVSSGATIDRIEVVGANLLLSPNVFYDPDENVTCAYLMAGGIVGASEVEFEKETGANGGYRYTRTTITMTSFKGTIAIEETLPEADETYIALGGIVGFNLGATILNNKAEVTFNVSENLAALSKTTDSIEIQVGGIVGIIYYQEIEEEKIVLKTIYPLVKNNLAIMTCDNLTDNTAGVIGKLPSDVQGSGQQWVWGNYFYTDNSKLTFGGSVWNYATIQVTNLSDLKKSATYITEALLDGTIVEKWSIGESISVWTIDEGVSSPEINFLVGIGEEATYPNEEYKINNINQFKYYYEKMTTPVTTPHEIASRKFWLSQNYTLNVDINLAEMGITNFAPIGHDYTFMGTFDGNGHSIFYLSEEGVSLPFMTNLSEDGSSHYRYAGIFAIINTGAEVRNLTVKGFDVDHAEFVGGIAGINLGKISNCYIENIKIGSSIYAGFIAGVNKGTIQNTVKSEEIDYSISLSSLAEIIIKDEAKTAYVGGVTGYNTGLISNIKIQGVLLITGQTSEKDVIRVIGGFVGYNSGTILNSSLEQADLADTSLGRIYIGGFCGINDGIIKSSYTGIEEGTMATSIQTDFNNGSQIAGGFVARLGYAGTLEKCFAIVDVKGYYAAGLAADLLGTASECYVKGTVSGVFIGGFACNMAFKTEPTKGGTLTNSYNTVKLVGVKEGSISAGLSLFIRNPGKIENCFVSNIFSGLGSKYYESYTDTRLKFAQYATSKISPVEGFGTVNNVVINTEADDTINEGVIDSGKFFADEGQKVYYLDKATCLAGSDAFIFAGFSVGPTSYWTIQEGFYPILTNLTIDNISQLPPPAEEPEEGAGNEGDDTGEGEGSGEGVQP